MALHILEVTPTVDTAQYASGDRLGSLMTLSGAADGDFSPTTLKSVVILDKAKQKSALDIFFFDASPTIASADNAALDITDAEMADKFLGSVTIAAADYKDLNASSVVTATCDLPLKPTTTAGTIYALLVSRGTPTYGAASDLVLRLSFQR
jgi:hypothetical protein